MLLDLNALQEVLTDITILGKDKEGKTKMFTLDKFIEYFEKKDIPTEGEGK